MAITSLEYDILFVVSFDSYLMIELSSIKLYKLFSITRSNK